MFYFIFSMLSLPYLLFSYELGVVTLFRDEANYLKEWVEYHHMLGVDHFLLYNDRSQDNWEEVLAPYIKANLVEVISWHKDEYTPLFPTWQIMAYKDGLRRSKGNTKWLTFIDIDEFILPKKTAKITTCLDTCFASASGVYMSWRNFGTNKVHIAPGDPILTHLTRSSLVTHSRNASGKSIVKVDDVMIDAVWSPHQLVLKEDAFYFDGSNNQLFFRGNDLQVTPYHTNACIQVNHYAMRDENFYQNVRLPKAISKEYGELSLLLELYESFNECENFEMVEFLKSHYPDKYSSFWQER
jgi:hypothetical protein